VWVGIAVERNAQGGLSGVNHPEEELGQLVKTLTARKPDACLVMHSPIDTILEALDIIKANWAGTAGTYPEAGEFRMPDWEFVDVDPAEFAAAAQGWRAPVRRSSAAAAASTPITSPPCRRTSLHEQLHRKLPVRRRKIRDRW
jgi:hypothetical protein